MSRCGDSQARRARRGVTRREREPFAQQLVLALQRAERDEQAILRLLEPRALRTGLGELRLEFRRRAHGSTFDERADLELPPAQRKFSFALRDLAFERRDALLVLPLATTGSDDARRGQRREFEDSFAALGVEFFGVDRLVHPRLVHGRLVHRRRSFLAHRRTARSARSYRIAQANSTGCSPCRAPRAFRRAPGAQYREHMAAPPKPDPDSAPGVGAERTPGPSFGPMGPEHWSRARAGLNAEALEYYRERDLAPGVAGGGAERNFYCMRCAGVIPFAPPAVVCPHCGAELGEAARRYFNWVEINEPPPSDLRPLLARAGLVVAAVLALAAAVWFFWLR